MLMTIIFGFFGFYRNSDNFTYNFDKKVANLKDIKVDDKFDQNLNSILNNVILKSDNLQNKIYFKNLLNKAIKSYAG